MEHNGSKAKASERRNHMRTEPQNVRLPNNLVVAVAKTTTKNLGYLPHPDPAHG